MVAPQVAGMQVFKIAWILLLACAALRAGEARAGIGQEKTKNAVFSPRDIDRSLVMPRNWFELTLGVDAKQARSSWSSEGEVEPWEYASFLYTTEWLRIRYGILPRLELHGTMPVHWIRLQNDLLGTDTAGVYWGDPVVGFRNLLLHRADDTLDLSWGLALKSPAGNESPGSYISGPGTFSEFITTTGTHDFILDVQGKVLIAPFFGVEGGVAYVRRTSGVVQYVLETTENQFAGRIKPGDQGKVQVALIAQGAPIFVRVGAEYEQHGATAVGTSIRAVDPGATLSPVEGSEGWSLDGVAALTVNVNRNLDLGVNGRLPLRGEDLMFFPIEDLHPTRGVTFGGTLELRY